MSAVIRCDPLDGQWQTLGTGRYRGIVAEGIEASSNSWGPDQMAFTIDAVQPGAIRPDLLPYTPVELEVDGMLVWAGRVKARPSTDRDYSLACEGWQYHLDDDVYDRAYVHTRMGDYRDQRTFLAANLTNFHVAGVVSNDNGTITIGWPNATVIPANGYVGVTLDLGPDSIGKFASMSWESTNNTSTISCFARTSTTESPLTGSTSDFFNFAMNTGASGSTTGTAATAYRYIHVFLFFSAGGTLGADVHLRITGLKIFRDAAYAALGNSVLKTDLVVRDARNTSAPLLNQTDAYITAGTFNIPECLTNGYVSPKAEMEAVNAYENYRLKIGGSDLKSLVYDVKPSTPLYEVGKETRFADASVAGEEIYSRAVVDGTGPDGARLVSSRTQTGTLVDRNGFARARVLPIRSAVTPAVADRFGDLWLSEHDTTPFAGKLTASTGIRRVLGGAPVPAHAMLLASGEKIRLGHRIDPDTGGLGRDGRIAAVTYKHEDRSVVIDVDDRRDDFQTILERYGIIVDQLG